MTLIHDDLPPALTRGDILYKAFIDVKLLNTAVNEYPFQA